jgi:Uma2 family endonuclease
MNILSSVPSRGQESLPVIAVDMPVMYEDEGQEEMGEAEIHVLTEEIVRNGIKDHLAGQAQYRVFSDLNVYYHPVDRWAYVSPDVMAVIPGQDLGGDVTSYRIGVDGPAPVLTVEVLSRRSFQQQDLTNKPDIYSRLRVSEYILVDVTGRMMPQRLLLKKLQSDATWLDVQDADGGVTSRLGFRLVIEPDGHVRVIDAGTGKRYPRPREAQAEARARQMAEETAQAEAKARQAAEERVLALEAEVARLRAQQGEGKDRGQ